MRPLIGGGAFGSDAASIAATVVALALAFAFAQLAAATLLVVTATTATEVVEKLAEVPLGLLLLRRQRGRR